MVSRIGDMPCSDLIYHDEFGTMVCANPTGNNYEIINKNGFHTEILFQMGIATAAVNGVTNEQLIVIAHDRIQKLNDKFPCPENDIAMEYLKKALSALHARSYRVNLAKQVIADKL